MKRTLILLPALLLAATTTLDAQTLRGWTKGKGFGWVWGKDDQIGALNAILGVTSRNGNNRTLSDSRRLGKRRVGVNPSVVHQK